MILDELAGVATRSDSAFGTRVTIDELFRRVAERRPEALALVDPPNRADFTDGECRALTYAHCDRMIDAIARQLLRLGLRTDAIVAMQFANTVETVLTLLAVLRAGLIAMPMPLLWRRADATVVLRQVGAQALIVTGRVGRTNHVELACEIAANVFSLRQICAFGGKTRDGVVMLDETLASGAGESEDELAAERGPRPGAHLALITWDVTGTGLVPVARSHAEVIAGGAAVLLEARLRPEAVILSSIMMSSFAGLASAIVPWLMVGGTLLLHHPFDRMAFELQVREADSVLVPGPLVAPLAEAGLLGGEAGGPGVVALWRSPERLQHAPPWHGTGVAFTDVQVFGELGLFAARRGSSGKSEPMTLGTNYGPRGATDGTDGIAVADLTTTARGTLALQGPMVPRCPFPPGADQTALPHLALAEDRFVDTGYGCSRREADNGIFVTGAPAAGLVSVGGYRFMLAEIEAFLAGLDRGAVLAALPCAFGSDRLAGSADDPAAVRAALVKEGINPLIAGAFREFR